MKYKDHIAEIYKEYPAIKEPSVKLIIAKEFLELFGKGNMSPAGALVEGDQLDYKIGPYKIELRFWNKDEEDARIEYDLYMAERGHKFEEEQYDERETDFQRWKEERQKK
jgi:hypothetical protein